MNIIIKASASKIQRIEDSFVVTDLFTNDVFLTRGCVGETVFHVCFLQGTTIHLHLAKRLLMHFPLLLNDIYLSDEYYGENVLHMSCVAEDPSVVKWLLDIGADFNR